MNHNTIKYSTVNYLWRNYYDRKYCGYMFRVQTHSLPELDKAYPRKKHGGLCIECTVEEVGQ